MTLNKEMFSLVLSKYPKFFWLNYFNENIIEKYSKAYDEDDLSVSKDYLSH